MANDVYIQVTLADNRIVNMYSIDPLLTYNTDPDLYCEWTGTRGTYKLYNSALLIKNGKRSPHDPDKLYLIGTFLSLTEGNRLTSTPDVSANQNLNSYNNIVGTTTKMWHNNMTDNDGRYLVDYGVLTCAITLLGSAIVDWQEGALPIFRDEEEYMNFITNPYQAPPQYTWTSVPSISGKNGILSLAQIKEEYINDGESVSGASADHFTNLSTGNRVDVLIDDALPAPEIGGTTVTVKYTIPTLSSGSYEYCKLVAKKNSMPEGPEDGDKIINIDPTAVSVSVKNLKGHTKYYFAIFIKDADGNESSSNTKSIMTQGAVIPEEYQQYLDLLALTAWGANSDTTLLTYLNRRGNSSTSVVSSDHSFATRDNFNNNSNCYAFSVLQMSTINISTDPVTVLYTCNVAEYDIIKTSGRDMWGVYSENGNGGDYITLWGSASGISSPGNTDGLRFVPTTSFNSLGDCLAYLAQHFRHVNVKVDGEYWLKLD